MLQDLGRHCKLFKIDLRNAFRLLPVRCADFQLLGFMFDGYYFVDKCIPFGCSISCSVFEKFATFLEAYIRSKLAGSSLIHYLDDFLGGDRSGTACRDAMSTFQRCLAELNVPIATEKTEGPSEIITFLGLELDSERMIVRIPSDKIADVVNKIQVMLSGQKTTLKAMQSLIGSLNFCCRAIVIGRPFCRRLINAICGLTKPRHHLRLNKGIRLDLGMWLTLFENHNGISVFHERHWISNVDAQLFTDSAAGHGLGFGAYFEGHWTYSAWPDRWHELSLTNDITLLELFPILVALHIWGEQLRNKKIVFHCDNMAVVHILNTMTSKSETVMFLVRRLAILCFHSNMVLKAVHVAGYNNGICDALSRLQLSKFRERAPAADPEPCSVPGHLWTAFSDELQGCCVPAGQRTHQQHILRQ